MRWAALGIASVVAVVVLAAASLGLSSRDQEDGLGDSAAVTQASKVFRSNPVAKLLGKPARGCADDETNHAEDDATDEDAAGETSGSCGNEAKDDDGGNDERADSGRADDREEPGDESADDQEEPGDEGGDESGDAGSEEAGND